MERALELGITYFDTAPSYGNGESERNLGAALRALRADVYVGTKFRIGRLPPEEIAGAVAKSLEDSLRRLGRGRVELLQLHDSIGAGARGLSVRTLLDAVVPALDKLVAQGKARFYGITALGDTGELLQAIDSGALATAQVCFNLLNPSAARPVSARFSGQDFAGLLERARRATWGRSRSASSPRER